MRKQHVVFCTLFIGICVQCSRAGNPCLKSELEWVGLKENNDHLREEAGMAFLLHVVRSLKWTSVIVVSQQSDEEGQEFARRLSKDNVTLTVFQWSSLPTSTQLEDLHKKAPARSGFCNTIVLGNTVFVSHVLLQTEQTTEEPLKFRWLTAIAETHAAQFANTVRYIQQLAIVIQHSNGRFTLEAIRNTDTTEMSIVTEWSPSASSDLPLVREEAVFPTVGHDLGGRTLRMGTMTWDPFTIRHQNETHTWYTGLCIDLLNILANKLNFTYTITEPTDRIWGSKLPNGTWAGLTGMLHRKEVDFVLAGMSVTAERATVTDHTTGFYNDEIVLMTTWPDPTPVGWTFYLRPFHWLTYLLIGCGVVVMTVVLVWLDRCSVKTNDNSQVVEDGNSRPLNATPVIEAWETMFGALAGRAVAYKAMSTSANVLLCSWVLLSMVVVATYTGKLTSNSVVIRQPLPFSTVGELVKRTDYRWGMTKGTMFQAVIATSRNKDYQIFYKKMMEFAAEDPDVLTVHYDTVALRKVLTSNYVHVLSYAAYEVFKSIHCELTVAQERMYYDTYGIHLQKRSPYTSMFNIVLKRAKEVGLIEHLRRKWLSKQSQCQGDDTSVVPVSLELVQTAFIAVAVGVGLAAIVLVLERLRTHQRSCHP